MARVSGTSSKRHFAGVSQDSPVVILKLLVPKKLALSYQGLLSTSENLGEVRTLVQL
jgi:hypothetical protein